MLGSGIVKQPRAVLHIAQELVRNAVTHGKARRVDLELRLADALTLVVRDDGTGMKDLRSSGGLASTARWLSDNNGAIELLDEPCTAVCVSLR